MKQQSYDALFTPFQVGNVTIKNRIVETAVTGTSLFDKGHFNTPVRDFYLARARGGAGLIVTGAAMVKDIFGRDYDLDQCGDVFDGPIRQLVEEIHAYGTKIFLQIGVGLGRVVGLAPFGFLEGANLDNVRTASSRLPNVWDPSIIHEEMTIAEIERRKEIAIWAAQKAKACGIDGVEIHAVHEGYLLDQFAIANMNHRNDEYGGSLSNRLRFATDIIRGIKDTCGEDYPISMRYSVVSKMKGLNQGALPGEDFAEFGRDRQESILVAKALEEAGCDLLDADNGTYDSWYWAHPPVYMQKACNLEDCTFIREHVGIPVVCAGRMEDTDTSAKAIESDRIDGIGVARQFLADPDWVNKLQEGRADDILPCIACHNGCLGSLLAGNGLSCALNPACMHEAAFAISPAAKPSTVLVVGGGIGGMEAARICALRGHHVIVCEKTDQLGGAFIAAAAPSYKEDDRRLISWYIRQVESLDIDVRMETEADEALIDEIKPDHVIVATGAVPKRLPIKGLEKDNVLEVKDYLTSISNNRPMDEEEKPAAGKKIVVVGGGLSGCEAAYELALSGCEVTVVEMMDDILQVKNLSAANANMLRDLLNYYKVEILTGTALAEVTEEGVLVRGAAADRPRLIPCDGVVLAAGYDPAPLKLAEPEDAATQEDGNPSIHYIGDAVKAGNLMDAIWSAYEVALHL